MDTLTSTTTQQLLGVINTSEPAKLVVQGREPDLYEDERAFWIGDTAVVSIEFERAPQILGVLATASMFQSITTPDQTGWTRLYPSQYGIEVMGFDGSTPSAQDCWTIAKEVTR